jgi:hypothetical protein
MIFKGLKMWLFQFTIKDDPSPNLGSKLQCPSQVCVLPSFSHSMPFFLYLIGPSFCNFLLSKYLSYIQVFAKFSKSLSKGVQLSFQVSHILKPKQLITIDNNVYKGCLKESGSCMEKLYSKYM